MGLLALVASFSYSLFFILQAFFGLNEGSFGLKIYSLIIFISCVVIYGFSFFRRKLVFKELFLILLLASIVIGFLMTKSIYSYVVDDFNATVLSFGVRSIPAFLIGIYIAKSDKINDMSKWLQPFMLIFTIGIIKATINSWDGNNINIVFGGTNYQLLSYQAAYTIGMNIFLIFNRNNIKPFKIFSNKFFLILNVFLIPIQLICLFIGGGRGAFVLLIVFAIYAFNKNIELVKNKKRKIIKSFLIIISFSLCLSIIFNLPMLKGGVSRLTNFFFNIDSLGQDDRTYLYIDALNNFKTSPIWGHGIGSVFYELRFYSHNIFTDLLVEGGILLFTLSLFILVIFTLKLKKLIYFNKSNELILICFLCSFVMLLFSGHYLRDSGIWFSMGYVFIREYKK